MFVHRLDADHGDVYNQQGDPARFQPTYYVELPADALDEQGSLLDSLIRFTLDTLHVQHLDLRIVAQAPQRSVLTTDN
jgi:hypothetical protein